MPTRGFITGFKNHYIIEMSAGLILFSICAGMSCISAYLHGFVRTPSRMIMASEASSFLNQKLATTIKNKYDTPCYVYNYNQLKSQGQKALSFPNSYGITVRFAMVHYLYSSLKDALKLPIYLKIYII